MNLLSSTEGPLSRVNLIKRVEHLSEQAAAILADRVRRARFFNATMFGEPPWEMLLNLYVAEVRGIPLNVSRLAEGSGVPLTTALRWLDRLENQRLVKRESDPADGRAYFIELTENARQLLELYLSDTLGDPREMSDQSLRVAPN